MLELAEYMENLPPEKYDQGMLWQPCGSPSCIAGHAAFLCGFSGRTDATGETATCHFVEKWLGLGTPEACALFDPSPGDPDDWSPTPQDAALTLRHLAETGSVVWRPQPEDLD